MFKVSANGVDNFCKVPSMLKPALNRWEINQQRELLKLKSGNDYANLIEFLTCKKSSLSISQDISESGHMAIDSDMQRLPCPHVAPLAAPTQSTAVAVSTKTTR